MKKFLVLLLAAVMLLSVCSFSAIAEDPIKISIYYSDNSTLPYKETWRTISYLEEKYNVDLVFELTSFWAPAPTAATLPWP